MMGFAALEKVDSGLKIWSFLVSGIYVRFAGCNYQLTLSLIHHNVSEKLPTKSFIPHSFIPDWILFE